MCMFADLDSTTPVVYGNETIRQVSEFKYLGFIIDVNLNWRAHFQMVVSKVKQRLYCLRRCKYSVSKAGRLLLFNALIMPYLTYGIELWFASGKTLRDSLELLLRHCLRIIVNDVGPIPALSSLLLYSNLDVLPLYFIFQLNLGQLISKYSTVDRVRS